MPVDGSTIIPKSATLECPSSLASVRLIKKRSGSAAADDDDSIIVVGRESQLLSNQQQQEQPCFLQVGRQAATADIRIQHGSISRKHAVLYFDSSSESSAVNNNNNNKNKNTSHPQPNSALKVTDLGGKHGTTVNGKRLDAGATACLRHGDKLQFGNADFVLVVEMVASPEAAALPSDASTVALSSSSSSVAATQQRLEDAGRGLSGRAKRQAEIDAMMASLDEAPVFAAVSTSDEQQQQQQQQSAPFAKKDESSSSSQPPLQQARQLGLPVSECLVIANVDSDHSTDQQQQRRRHAVTALAVDPAGARFVVGTSDSFLRFYDFAGLTVRKQTPFRTTIPQDGHWPVSVCFSNTGDRLLVGTTSVQPIVLHRDGHEVLQFVRGDMYVTDVAKTLGHTAAVSAVAWHPLERDHVLTAAADGSVRLWNLTGRTQFHKLVCAKVYAVKDQRGRRTAVQSLAFHPSGRTFCLGTVDGSLQVWSRQRVASRPDRAYYADANSAVTSVAYNVDGTRLVSRTAEGAVHVWDPRTLSRPLATVTGATTAYEEHANAVLDPTSRFLCVPVTELDRAKECGRLLFYQLDNNNSQQAAQPGCELALTYPLPKVAPIAVVWHAKLQQLFVSCSNGSVRILYDPTHSKAGAVGVSRRSGRSADGLTAILQSRAVGAVHGPVVTPLYTQDILTNERKRRRLARKDPVQSREPERPATGQHKMGGRQTASTFAMYVADQRVTKTKPIAGKDPREALFQYTEGDSSYIEGAYEGNQSKLDTTTAEEALQKGEGGT